MAPQIYFQKKINLNYCKKYYDAEVSADWSAYCSPIISKNTSPYLGIELDYNLDTGDKRLVDDTNFAVYKTANVVENKQRRLIKPNLSPATYRPTSPFEDWMQQNGRTTVNGQSDRAVKPRLCYYSGLFSISGVIKPQYDWLSASYSLRNNGVSITRNVKFASEETFWKNTFEATFQINLRKINLSSFDLKSKVHINGWNYLIKRIVMDCNNPEKSLLEAYRA